MSNWVFFAVAAMLLFSFSNTFLKMASDKFDLGKVLTSFVPALLVGIIGFLVVFLFMFYTGRINISQELAALLGGALVFSVVGVVLFVSSLKQGKVAEVTAILSLSTIVVALISTHFLSVQFTLREIAAMLLAVVSIALFVL